MHFSKLNYYLIIFLMLFCCSNAIAKVEGNPLTKIDSLKSSPNFNPQSTAYIDLLIDLAQVHILSDTTTIILKEAYDLSITTGYYIGECSTLSIYGNYFSKNGQTEKAIEYSIKALEVANNNNLNNEKIIILNNMGQFFWLQGDDARALTKYLEALTVAKKIEDQTKMATLNLNIAELYNNNGDFETALAFYEISKQLSIKDNNQLLFAYALLYIAKIYSKQGKLTDAETTINKSVEIFNELVSYQGMLVKYGTIEAYEEKGNIILEKSNHKEALKWYKKSEELCNKINYGVGYTEVYVGLAYCYFELKELELSEKYAKKALEISKELNVLKAIKESNLILSKIYHKKGQDNKAYEYQSEYITLYEKGSAEKFKKGLGVLRSKMEFENQKKHLIEENNKALAKQKIYIYLALAALLFVSLFLALIFRTQRLQKKFTTELSDSNKTKDKLFSVIAHDLRGPINSFYSLMKLYMDKEFSKEDTEHLFPKAMDDIGNISDMLNNLLLWAKTQMQGTTIKQENIDVNNIANDTILLLDPLAAKKSIKINNNIAKNTISFSDSDHINIVLRNLISNAIKFTNTNGEININATELDNELQIAVTDNGVGMDLETQSKLFEKNNTNSTYGTNNEKGTGLGLSLCKDMVESNGGKIWVSSIQNKGTTIYFTIPTKQQYLKAV